MVKLTHVRKLKMEFNCVYLDTRTVFNVNYPTGVLKVTTTQLPPPQGRSLLVERQQKLSRKGRLITGEMIWPVIPLLCNGLAAMFSTEC